MKAGDFFILLLLIVAGLALGKQLAVVLKGQGVELVA